MSAPTEQPVHVPRFDVTGRVAIVTGASSGLGRQFARVLHAAGAQVIAAAPRKARLAQLAEACPVLVPHALDVTADVPCRATIAPVVPQPGRTPLVVNQPPPPH